MREYSIYKSLKYLTLCQMVLVKLKEYLNFVQIYSPTTKIFYFITVGIKVHNNMLGLGLLSEDAELSEEGQVVVRGSQLKSHK